MANPPPIPPPPAGFWWRTLACLADIIPLMVLGWALAGLMAGPEELAARQQADDWTQRFTEQYVKAIKTGSPRDLDRVWDMALKPKDADREAFKT
ncbi:MAG: hypothetical protein RLY12_1246, partial [Verrucomicrobiota bacterium]